MALKDVSARTLLVSMLTGCFLSMGFIVHFTPAASVEGNPALLMEQVAGALEGEPVRRGLPVRLSIPKIGVGSLVEYVGLNAGGDMDAPKDRGNVAWFTLGQRPGEPGVSVIAGHYGVQDGRGSAFDNLHNLREGDRVYVEDDQGVTVSFVVRKVRRYGPEENASDVFLSGDGGSHLNLVTCEGDWDEAQGGYPTRLVVFTDRAVE